MRTTVLLPAVIVTLAILLEPLTALGELVSVGTAEIRFQQTFTDGSITIWGDGHEGSTVQGGIYKLNKGDTSSGDGDLLIERNNDGVIWGFCIDLPQWAPGAFNEYDVVMPEGAPLPKPEGAPYDMPMGFGRQEFVRELWGRHYDNIFEGTLLAQERKAEAFSAAIWEIVYSPLPEAATEWDVSSGYLNHIGFQAVFSDDSDLNTYLTGMANDWLHSLNGQGPKADLRALTHDVYQDYLAEIPEPGTVVNLVGLGVMIGLAGFWQRRRRR